MTTQAIQTFELRKVFNESKVAVAGLTLTVPRGEVFGFLGPNGAGKTTSIKMLLGLVHPTSGHGTLLGRPIDQPTARNRVGFLPEGFRFHEWMSAREFLDIHGELYGMDKADRTARAGKLLARVGLADAAGQRLKSFSKGMLQRVGLAMALLPRPELVFLDEPTSGLDPFGRLLVRDVIREVRDEGTSVFLNSHLLGEIEATCDRVAFIRQGRVLRSGSIDELVGGLIRLHLRLGNVPGGLLTDLEQWGDRIEQTGERDVMLTVPDEIHIAGLNAWLVGQGIEVFELAPHRVSLEELFVQIINETPDEENAQ